jgi:putative ABC transport system permease protein
LVRKALAETLTLSLFGAAAGIVVAYAGVRLILHLAFNGPENWIPVEAAPSTPVLLFALAISPIEALRGANRSVGGSRQWTQKTLVIVQVAVSLVLLSAAAMLGRSLRNLEHQNFGFDPSGRYLASIDPKLSNYKQEESLPLYREIEDRLRAIPGVRAVSPVLYAPLSGLSWGA